MRRYTLEIDKIENPIYPASLGGLDPDEKRISLTNYYLEIDKKPYFAICGEAHFARMQEHTWEDEIIKMKMGGLKIIAAYVFWIHHEEIEGEFDWSGNKNLRKFLRLCDKHDMKVILRIGPFDHGECRNGGYPDWIFGRPFDLRSNNPEYLYYTKRWWAEIGKQANGLMFKDNGPVIAVQLENEYEHASAPWEMTTENSKEWIPSGSEGEEHIKELKKIAQEVGLITPFYTSTAWGGSCAPENIVLPLWGGYAFRPWMFYGDLKEHPATAEYLMNDFHNNASPQYYNFDPEYPKEELPYACCEMGGGMNVFYQYRFQLPYESVGAMAAVKVASGCNFLGYYMYHGGTNPSGKRVPYLNECALPKFSYDYQAAIGEFGQVRDSYHYLKLQHMFYSEFEEIFCSTKTYLPVEAETQIPEEVSTLRYAVRVNEKEEGFVFINNYQDHVELQEQKDFAIELKLPNSTVRFPQVGTLNIDKGQYAILPFHLKLGDVYLEYATAQLITKLNYNNEEYFFFHQVPGMTCEFVVEGISVERVVNGTACDNCIKIEDTDYAEILFDNNGKRTHFCIISQKNAMRFWKFEYHGQEYVMLSDANVLAEEDKIRLECDTDMSKISYEIFPHIKQENSAEDILFQSIEANTEIKAIDFTWEDKSTVNKGSGVLKRPVVGSPITSSKVINARAIVKVHEEDLMKFKHLMLSVDYDGDIGYAFTDGKMFHDNFCNGDLWEIDLKLKEKDIAKSGMYIYISPRRYGAKVNSESAMAAVYETAEKQVAKINGITIKGIFDYCISDDWLGTIGDVN